VRFPDCLRPPGAGCAIEPVAAQPGQSLTPELCAVVLRADRAEGTRLGLWRPATRHVEPLATPRGWLAGSAWWSAQGVLCLPYASADQHLGVAEVLPSGPNPQPETGAPHTTAGPPASSRVVPLQQAPLASTR
jgi:hypothetical protein